MTLNKTIILINLGIVGAGVLFLSTLVSTTLPTLLKFSDFELGWIRNMCLLATVSTILIAASKRTRAAEGIKGNESTAKRTGQ
ncbi:hypothetical protein [Undibacterium fentianense]|uniref:Uncharacterized protein n=1 Tax=Undibacterium fentianense TaxID=2828728 RepID=A0A941E1B6_9BURK|nr:hypothetical protein [Undibacterium fentianense]MBR7800555.1 hypothetical protein [Undibacterium fentianense]